MHRIRLSVLILTLVAASASAIAGGSARLVYPNPFFTEGCTFTLTMPKDDQVRIAVYDMLGREVADLTERLGRWEYPAGVHEIKWDGTDRSGNQVNAGTYVCVLWSKSGELINSVKVVKAMTDIR
jgi:flagellar hook assembly protein FlgD